MPNPPPAHHRVLHPSEVIARTSLSRTTLWRKVRRSEFPRPIHLSPNRIGWDEAAVEEWIAAQIASSLSQQEPAMAFPGAEGRRYDRRP